MKRFIKGADRGQSTLLPECLDDWIGDDNVVRAVDVFVDGLNLAELGFAGVIPEATGRPSYHPSAVLKLLSQSRPVDPAIGARSGTQFGSDLAAATAHP